MKYVQRQLASRTQMYMRAPQDSQLILTRDVVQKRAERDDDEREPFVERERAHVALARRDAMTRLLGQRYMPSSMSGL